MSSASSLKFSLQFQPALLLALGWVSWPAASVEAADTEGCLASQAPSSISYIFFLKTPSCIRKGKDGGASWFLKVFLLRRESRLPYSLKTHMWVRYLWEKWTTGGWIEGGCGGKTAVSCRSMVTCKHHHRQKTAKASWAVPRAGWMLLCIASYPKLDLQDALCELEWMLEAVRCLLGTAPKLSNSCFQLLSASFFLSMAVAVGAFNSQGCP